MFLNKTQFKKWIKNAFNRGGLIVGRIYDGLVISGNSWVVWVDENYIPNWIKAAVVEHVGEMPADGYVIRAQKDESIQYEVSENEYFDLPERFIDAKHPFTVTPVIYTTRWSEYRLMQNRETGEVVPLLSEFYNVIDYKELEGESRPTGPSAASREGSVFIWKNEISALAVCRTDFSEKSVKLLEVLKEIDFEKEGN